MTLRHEAATENFSFDAGNFHLASNQNFKRIKGTMDALLIIDMQKASFGRNKRFDAEGVVTRINQLSGYIRKNGGVVIFIQHDGTRADGHKPFTRGWEILEELELDKSRDIKIRKTTCDAFYETNLGTFLVEHVKKRLFITGCATDFCVDSTIRSAVSKDFELVVPSDGHTTADRDHLAAKAIIKHHNYVWENLIAPDKPVRVLPTREILEELA